MLKVFLMGKTKGWMTKKMGSEEETGRRGKVQGMVRVCEREKDVISCATEPHSRHERNSR